MTKVTSDHLARAAYVYVRRSTADHLLHNHESRRRHGLAERAKSGLGGGRRHRRRSRSFQLGASAVRVSSGFWRRSAKDASARCLRSMRRAWRAMAVIGTRLPRRQASRRIVRRWTLPFRARLPIPPMQRPSVRCVVALARRPRPQSSLHQQAIHPRLSL